MDLNPVQSEKLPNPNSSTEPGKVNVDKPVQFSKAIHAIFLIPSGIIIEVIPLH